MNLALQLMYSCTGQKCIQ